MVCNIEHKMWLDQPIQAMGLDPLHKDSCGGDIEYATWNLKKKQLKSNNPYE